MCLTLPVVVLPFSMIGFVAWPLQRMAGYQGRLHGGGGGGSPPSIAKSSDTVRQQPRCSLQQLRHLDLSFASVTDAGVVQFSAAFVPLESLCLRGCNHVTDVAAAHVSAASPQLQHLDLQSCSKLTDSGMEYLGHGLRQLRYINVLWCEGVTESGIRCLQGQDDQHIAELLECHELLQGALFRRMWTIHPQDRMDAALVKAINFWLTSGAKLLIRFGADVCSTYNPLLAAAKQGDPAMVSLLLQSGGDPNVCCHAETPLYTAVLQNNLVVAEMLATYGADVCRCDGEGSSLLFTAAKHGHGAMVKLLVAYHADVNKCDQYGNNPLSAVVRRHDTELARLLLDRGACADASNHFGTTALLIAADLGSMDIVAMLVQHGADVAKRDSCGTSALLAAAKQRNIAAVKFLLELGADIDVCDHVGASPRTAMLHSGDQELVRLASGLTTSEAALGVHDSEQVRPLEAIGHDARWTGNTRAGARSDKNPEGRRRKSNSGNWSNS